MAQPFESTTDHPTDDGPAASQIRDCGKQVHETRSQQRGPIGFERHEAEAKYANPRPAQATGLDIRIGDYTAKQLSPNQWTKSPADHTHSLNDKECRLDDETCIERIEEEQFIPSDRRCSDDDEDVSACWQHNSHVTERPPISPNESNASDAPKTYGDQVNSGESYHTSDRMAHQFSKDMKGVPDEIKTNKQVQPLPEADQPYPPISLPPPSATMAVHVQPDKGDVVDSDHTVYCQNNEWIKGENIGSGGYGSCFCAQDVKHGTIMVVKQVKLTTQSKEEQKKVINEVTIMAELKHHNIVRCLGATQESGYLNIFLEWMPGGSLQRLLKDHGPFSALVIAMYTKQIVTGVEFIHRCKIIHGDVKGDNILVDFTGRRVKIADFGSAVRFAEVDDNVLRGTPPFVAPEVLRIKHYDTSVDVWSIGCLIIQMATGKLPWAWSSTPLISTCAYYFKIGWVTELTETVTKELGIDELKGEVKNFAICCMNPNHKDRPKAANLFKHALLRRV